MVRLRFVVRVAVVVAAVSGALGMTAPVSATASRTAVSDYITTATGDSSLGVICTETDALRGNGLGNVCFPIHEGEQKIAVAIVDKYSKAVGTHYEFGIRGDGPTLVLATGTVCTTATLAIPPTANEFRMYFGIANTGAPAPCTSPSPGVQGTVTATFS